MISDVIIETISEITRYQKALPHVYEDDTEMLEALLQHLDTVRRHYDAPPEQTGLDAIQEHLEFVHRLNNTRPLNWTLSTEEYHAKE